MLKKIIAGGERGGERSTGTNASHASIVISSS
jgi:hypothetical protein